MLKDERSQLLFEGWDADEQNELGNLDELAGQLSAWQIPEPTDGERRAFTERLAAQLSPRIQVRSGWRAWKDLMLAQIKLFAPEFWYACAGMLVFTLIGGLVIGKGALSLFTVIVSPLVATAGVLYAFRSDSISLTRLEMASPIGPLTLFFCRSGLILAVNLAAIPLLLVPGQLLFPELVFWRVILIWLGALIGIYGLAIYTSIRWNGILKIVLPLGVWGILVAGVWQQAIYAAGENGVAFNWLVSAISTSNFVLAGAVIAFLVGCVLFFQAVYWVERNQRQWA
jgi:hypothetical protein